VNIETATLNDTKEIVKLFTNTIHKINIQNYTQKQIEVWAPIKIDYEKWEKRFKKTNPYIIKKNNKIVGFFEFETNGHIGCFYVHHNYQRQGVGNIMISKIIDLAKEQRLDDIFAEVSITAKPFFEQNLFITQNNNIVTIDNVELVNYIMIRQISNKHRSEI